MASLDTLMGLLIVLRTAGVRLEIDSEGLRVEAPSEMLTELLRASIRHHQTALLALPRPYLSAAGDLITPVFAPPQYHWQPIADTLRELNAPPDVWQRYGRVPPEIVSSELVSGAFHLRGLSSQGPFILGNANHLR